MATENRDQNSRRENTIQRHVDAFQSSLGWNHPIERSSYEESANVLLGKIKQAKSFREINGFIAAEKINLALPGPGIQATSQCSMSNTDLMNQVFSLVIRSMKMLIQVKR